MKLEEILSDDVYTCNREISDIEIDGITTSAQKIKSNTLFVVIRSINFDVGKIINYVINKRPCAIICDFELPVPQCDIPTVRCENTRRILPYLYSRFYGIDYSKMRFCAVTGTNGKTSTATMLAKILSHSGKKIGFIGTGKIIIGKKLITPKKYSMTTPDPELLYSVLSEMQSEECEFVVMEVSSHALYFEKVAPIPFEISVFTNLSSEHMDFHANMTDYYNTKLKLFSQTKIGIFNSDDKYSLQASKDAPCNKRTVGIEKSADIRATDITSLGLFGSEYIYRERNRLFKVKLHLGGIFNIYNSMLAISAAVSLGVRPCVAKEAIGEIEFIDGRLEIIKDDITVIIDYAHTEQAFINVLKTINSAKNSEQKLTTIFGCGGDRDSSKRPKMAAVAEMYSDYVIVTTDNSRTESKGKIIKDILSGFRSTEKRKVITSRAVAIENAILSANKNDIVAIIGKGHERYNIDNHGYKDFDERDIIKGALKKRKTIYEDKA